MKKMKAVICEQNGQKFYLGVLDRDTLKINCYVSRADEDLEKGFQRLLNKSRASQISKYIDKFEGVIPSALILSAQKKSKFVYNTEDNSATFISSKGNFLVLDGQHRLYGYIKSKSNLDVPVVIFEGLNPEQEVNLFIDINTNQKGVSSSLLLDIKNLTGKENTVEAKQRKLFESLNENSVLAGKFSPRKTTRGKISKKAFYDSTKSMFEGGRFANAKDSHIYNGVKNYLEACEIILNQMNSDKAKLTRTIVFKAFFNVFQDIVELCLKKYGNLKVESFEKELSPISILNFDNYNGSSASLINQLTVDIKREINRNNNISYDFNDNSIF